MTDGKVSSICCANYVSKVSGISVAVRGAKSHLLYYLFRLFI